MDYNQQLIELERSLLSPQIRGDSERVKQLLHPAFKEVSQTGYSYGRDVVLAAFSQQTSATSGYEASNFEVRQLTPTLAQVTYETRSIPKGQMSPRQALRSSLWIFEDGRWQMIYHQGTLKAEL